MFGAILIYYFRIFERQMGSAKFGGFTFMSILSSTFILIPFFVFFSQMKGIPSGPYSFIFSCFVQFYFDIPATYRFRICGIPVTDKFFTYILGLQLIFSNFHGSVLVSICGILGGLLYRLDAFRVTKFQFPSIINNFATRFLLPFLQSTSRTQRSPIQINQIGQPLTNVSSFPSVPSESQGFSDQLLSSGFSMVSSHSLPVSEDSILLLTSMGFSRETVIQALRRTNNDVHLATNILLDSTH